MSTENLIFFIISILFLAVLAAAVTSVAVIIFKLLKKIFSRKDNGGRDTGGDIDIAVRELEESKEERQRLAEKKLAAGPKLGYATYNKPAKDAKQKEGKKEWSRQEAGKIEEGLNKLKADAAGEGQPDGNVYPQREGEQKVAIPRAKQPEDDIARAMANGQDEKAGQSRYSVKDISGSEKAGLATSKGALPSSVFAPGAAKDSGHILKQDLKIDNSKNPAEVFYSDKKVSAGKKQAEKPSQKDSSIFGGKSEVSRIDLRQKLRRDTNVWKAERQTGLTLNAIERAKLEKEIFPQAYGRNISKTDLNWGVKRLNQKMLSEKNLSQKGKLRKEIKFLKKIGGIK